MKGVTKIGFGAFMDVGDSYFEEVLNDFRDYIMKETLSLDIIKKDNLSNEVELNDIKVFIDVERR